MTSSAGMSSAVHTNASHAVLVNTALNLSKAGGPAMHRKSS
jgi:hypothetical protein